MIVTTQKPLNVILDYLVPYNRILIAGCDGCTQPPRGLREANTMSQLLELGGKLRNKEFQFKDGSNAINNSDPNLWNFWVDFWHRVMLV